jgi:hypothetical protein
MNNPIKIIYKYKNDNRRIQYQNYIFVGSLISSPLLKVLKKIENLNLFDTLISINEKEYKLIEEYYGEFWYKFFFINDHIIFSINNIIKNIQKRTDIIEKYSKEWYIKHIENIKLNKSQYNFQSVFKKDNLLKLKKNNVIDENDNQTFDYTYNTYNTKSNVVINKQTGGKYNDEDDEDDNDDDNQQLNEESIDDNIFGKISKENIDENYEGDVLELDEVYDLEELDKMYREESVLVDKNPNKIKDLIDLAIENTDENRSEKLEKIIEFNNSKNNLVYDDVLKNVYTKNYVFNQYIFKSDTIKTIKQKICCGIQMNKIFNKTASFLLPSRMYLWIEYDFIDTDNKTKKDKLMLGQKWIRKNELLTIDIVPNESFHIYEKLEGNLKLLKDNIKKYGSKIKREDDENNILSEYDDFFQNNEIYLLDIYNEIGSDYKIDADGLKNVYDVYIRIYFYDITQDEFKNIIDFVNSNDDLKRIEINKILSFYQNINNDLLLENEITRTIEQVKIDKFDYKSILKYNYITQAVIHVNLDFKIINDSTINLHRIFDNYITDDIYPFVQYLSNGDKPIFKFNKNNMETDKQAISAKWFENSPYGINFKIKVEQKGGSANKYIAVTLFESGRLEYKTQWKEDDKAIIDDIKKTYKNIEDLLKKLNSENKKLSIVLPETNQFKYAFINSIQHFELPNKYSINHNDLSDFSRFFFPYISLVIEPRKRQSKNLERNIKSKYGTYLRYKRISKYENEAKIENRIIHFLRNYEFIPNILATEISKQFNITEKIALEKIEDVIKKNPLLKKSRRILKKLENIPKFKPPGIGIDIQGRAKENYKIRICGARSQEQLEEILDFIAILLYIYVDTYLKKNSIRLKIKEKLKILNNIAKRRNKVADVIEVLHDINNVKEITKLDKERIGFKPEKGQSQWTRACQNSGDKKRRPIVYSEKNIDEMIKTGYILNPVTNDYEKKYNIVENGKKKEIILTAAKLSDGASGSLLYTCNPDENNEYMHIGFLSRSQNPSGLCMPCCFKKDPLTSKNRSKKNYFLECVGKLKNDASKIAAGDKLYILQDTNKMLPGRFGYLPKYIDYFFNTTLNKTKVIKNNYLLSSVTGYFMKYGSLQENFPYLNAIASCLDLDYDFIINKIKQNIIINKYFTYMNNGDIKTQYNNNTDDFLNTINTNLEIDHSIIDDLICIPGVLIQEGLNIYIIEKKILFLNDKIVDDYVLLCKNIENLLYYNDPLRKNIIILKEDYNYYPIFEVYKDESVKNINIVSTFKNLDENNIILQLSKYMNLSCINASFENNKIATAKYIYINILKNAPPDFTPIGQIIDLRNKCKYLVTKNKFLIPCLPSGSLYELEIFDDYIKYVKTLDETVDFLNKLSTYVNIRDITKKDSLAIGFIYSSLVDNMYSIDAIIIDTQITIPVINIQKSKQDLEKLIEYPILQKKSINDIIDIEISKGNNNIEIDDRILDTQKNKFLNESFELFRFELSNYLNLFPNIKNKIIKILETKKINSIDEIKKILLKISSSELYSMFEQINNNDENISKSTFQDNNLDSSSDSDIQNNNYESDSLDSNFELNDDQLNLETSIVKRVNEIKNTSKFIEIIDNLPDYKNYNINNNRELCSAFKTKNECNIINSCKWVKNGCYFAARKEEVIEFIAKIADELVNNELKSKEILNVEQYFVSDIVNYENFIYRENQKIIKSDNVKLNTILLEIFGTNNIPIIGRKKLIKSSKIISDENILNPIEKIGNYYYQKIIYSNIIFRAYSNSIFWIKNIKSETSFRNLGYYSTLQTNLANLFRSYIYDWIIIEKNQELLYNELHKHIKIKKNNLIDDYKNKLFMQKEFYYLGIIDLFILNTYHEIPIILLDQYDNIFLIIDKGIVYNKILDNIEISETMKNKYMKNNIMIKYILLTLSFNSIPSNIISVLEI